VVRGAPAIGCAAAFGVYLIHGEIPRTLSREEWAAEFDSRCAHLAETRPTAVNLRWAVERCRKAGHRVSAENHSFSKIAEALENEALAILDEDRRMCEQIGLHGLALLQKTLGGRTSTTLMTHCNAGALATGGSGTALAVMYAAQQAGLAVKVFADETRPLLQGARLTSWELARAGIDVTVHLRQHGRQRTPRPEA